MIKTHRDTSFASCGIIHALHDDTIKLFNHGESACEFVNAEFIGFIEKSGVAPRLLFCCFSPLPEVPGNTASTKNCDNTTRKPTELATCEYGCAKNQHYGVDLY